MRSKMYCVVLAVLLLASSAFAQSNTAGCGGVNCIQGRIGVEQLDNTTAQIVVSNNGAKLLFGQNSEDLTLSTGGATTDTTGNLLPANAFIISVAGTLTTTITGTCTGWQMGDPTTAGRFTASDTTLTQGESKVGSVHATTGVASATTGAFQSAAAKVRVTCATGAPSAGKLRITVFYWQIIPPQI